MHANARMSTPVHACVPAWLIMCTHSEGVFLPDIKLIIIIIITIYLFVFRIMVRTTCVGIILEVFKWLAKKGQWISYDIRKLGLSAYSGVLKKS